jgi:hypothetical protein
MLVLEMENFLILMLEPYALKGARTVLEGAKLETVD